MLKKEIIYRELLYQLLEKSSNKFTQLGLSKKFSFSLSTINNALSPLREMNAIEVNLKNFRIIDAKKLLYYWASIRNIKKDIVFQTRVNSSVQEIEASMPDDITYAAYSAYKFRFKDVPADYSEVYVYGDDPQRFPKNSSIPNLFVLKKDLFIEMYGKTATLAALFVDLWNQKEWYAKDFLNAVEAKINGILE